MWCVFDSVWKRDVLLYVLLCDVKLLIDVMWFVLGEFIFFMNIFRIFCGGVIWVVLIEFIFVIGVVVVIVWFLLWKIGRVYIFICFFLMFVISVLNCIWGVVGVNMLVEKFLFMILFIDWLLLGNVFRDVLILLFMLLFVLVFMLVFMFFFIEKLVLLLYLLFIGVKFIVVCFCGFFLYNRCLMIFMRVLSFGWFNIVE